MVLNVFGLTGGRWHILSAGNGNGSLRSGRSRSERSQKFAGETATMTGMHSLRFVTVGMLLIRWSGVDDSGHTIIRDEN